jgi:anti-anti-sigma regulatory factor
MKVNFDTKEKFTVITPLEPSIYDNMTDELLKHIDTYGNTPPFNIVINLKQVKYIDNAVAEQIMQKQQFFYENSRSFVVCEVGEAVDAILEKLELTDIMNITPTESEACDIVQMEEIERELLDDEDVTFES